MFEKLLVKIGKALDKFKIPYMIIGGQAVLIYGEPRLTKDIDITLGISIDKLSILLEISQKLNFEVLIQNIEEFVKRTFVLPTKDKKTGIRIDFIFSFSTYERQAIERAVEINFKGYKVKFASPEDVIIHKIFAGRARDMEDVKSILIKNPSLNLDYIKKWLREFNKSFPEMDLLHKFEQILSDIGEF